MAGRHRKLLAVAAASALGMSGPLIDPAGATSGATITSATTTAVPAPAAAEHGPVALTEADTGATVELREGQHVTVRLDGGQQWDPVRHRGRAVRRTHSSGGYPTSRPARATFRASRPGRAALMSTSDAACLHAIPPCEISQQSWSVHIIVRERHRHS